MYLISAVVKNYRLHKELKVDFDELRTIIGGPNETGKSTLLEAIHHALFLKAKGNKKEHREMKSALFLGDPEVELEFVVHGVKYKLAKRFGSNGIGSLSIEGTGTLYNADADDKLFSLLGEDAGTNQWAHLWIKQGESGFDPSTYANEQRNELLLQLQKHGAAAVVQSEIDTRIASQFEAEVNSIYTSTSKVKKDSDLGRASDDIQSRIENLSTAEGRLQRLDAAAADLESVETELPQVLLALKNLKDDKEVLEAKEKSLQELKEKSKEEKHAENDAKEKLKQLVETNDLIIKQAMAIKKAENSIGPAEEELKQLDQKIRIVKDLTIQAEVEYNLAFQAQQSARDLMDFANVSRQHIEYSDQLKKIKSALVKANKIQDDIIAKTKKLAEITLVEKKDLAKLQKLESKVSETVAVLEAMAAGLEVVKADQQIMVAGKSVKKGDKVILTEDTEIEAGKGIKFRITPGGGTSLAEARSSMSDANAELKKKLNELGVISVSEAAGFLSSREEIQTQINSLQIHLDDLDLNALKEDVTASENEIVMIETKLETLKKRIKIKIPVISKEEFRVYENDRQQDFEDAENRAKSAKSIWDKKLVELNEHIENNQRKNAEFSTEKDQYKVFIALYKSQIETHGSDEVLQDKIAKAELLLNSCSTVLQQTINAIAELQPEMLEVNRRRIDDALQRSTDRRGDLQTQKGGAQALLRSEGNNDPKDEHNAALLRWQRSKEHHKHLEQKAEALRLLDNLFKQEQQSLSDQYSKPLAEKIAIYLRSLFGVGTKVHLNIEEGEFKGFSLQRESFQGQTFSFGSLSGGTREQVASAVRLAMAEVLAEAHDGCLPLVFDDSFVNADPKRTADLQSMLYLAGDRGLQIIVLTCTPADYTNLGAKLVILDNPSRVISQALMPSENGDSNLRENAEIATPDLERLQDELVSSLRLLGGKSGNQTLCEQLGWDEEMYSFVKDRLIEKGILKSGKGRGGSISIAE